MSYRSITGLLVAQSNGDYHFQFEYTKEFVEVKFRSEEQAAATPTLERISISITNALIDGEYYLVSEVKPWFTRLHGQAAAPITTPLRIALFYIQTLNYVDEDGKRFEKYKKETYERGRWLENYYKHHYGDVREVEVRSFAFHADVNYHPPAYAYKDMRNWAFTHPEEMDGFEPTHWHVYGGYSQAYCGVATIRGNRGVTYTGCGFGTTGHEIGHNLGMYHASTKDEDGGIATYGDNTDIQGKSRNKPGFAAVHREHLGIQPTEGVLEISEEDGSREVFLAPQDLNHHSLHDNEWHVLRFPGREPIFAALQKGKGMPYIPLANQASWLYIHSHVRNGHSMRLLQHMEPGEVREIQPGVSLHYIEYDADMEIARVHVLKASDGVVPSSGTMPTGFSRVPLGARVSPERSGIYHRYFQYGQGLVIHITGGRCIMYWFTNNHNATDQYDYSGNSTTAPRFYYGVGDVVGSANTVQFSNFEIFTTGEDGDVYPTLEDATVADVRSVGQGQIYFLGGTCIFSFNMPEFGRNSLELEPIGLSDNDNTGAYYEPVIVDGEDVQKQGFTFQFFDYLGRYGKAIGYWFTYGPPLDNNYKRPMANTCQRWYMLECTQTGEDSGVYQADIFEVHNGRFMRVASEQDIDVASAGSAILTVLNNDRMRLNYDLTAPDNLDNGELELRRLS